MKKQKISELLERGVAAIYPSKEFLERKLNGSERLTVYHGIDPTGPTLHVGHSVPLLKLAQFQELSHEVILLIGDFTAMIGDPTDKMAARVSLTREEVLRNATLYKKQASRIIKFSGENPAKLRYNSKWLAKMPLEEMLRISSNITHAQTIKRDMFQKRIAEGKDLYLHEFMYPLMQGYDSVALNVDGEVGGSDQTFNMLVGRDLMKKLRNKEKFVVSMKLLVDSSGKKMGKTEDNMVTLNENASEMFGKIMSWPDSLIVPGLELCTTLPMREIETLKIKLGSGMNPRDAKLILAEEIVRIYHGKGKAKTARKNFLSAFSEGETPGDAKEIRTRAGSLLAEVLLSAGVVESRSEFRRLIAEGAVRDMGTDEKIADPFYKTGKEISLKVGKHRFVRIKIES